VTSAFSPADIESWLKRHIAGLIGVRAETIDGDADFESFGIDSVQGVDMVVALETWLAMPDEIPMELLFEAATIADAARNVAERKASAS